MITWILIIWFGSLAQPTIVPFEFKHERSCRVTGNGIVLAYEGHKGGYASVKFFCVMKAL